jgi:hypothetical protein
MPIHRRVRNARKIAIDAQWRRETQNPNGQGTAKVASEKHANACIVI